MGIFGNILIFILALPFLAACLNMLFFWLGMGAFLTKEFIAIFMHPALLTLSFIALVFGLWRIRRFIRRNDSAHREEALLQKLEDDKDKNRF